MHTIHPTQEHIVLTPDNGCIECKHAAAAKRVRDELNARDAEIANLRHTVFRLTENARDYSAETRLVEMNKRLSYPNP